MQYREIGKTGKQASVIGLGCEHLDRKPYSQVERTIHTALDQGINYMDVFMPGKEVRENIAKSLGAKRRDIFIQAAIGSSDIGQQYDISRDLPTVKRYFEESLRIFGGYIDFGLLFYIDSEEDFSKVFDGGIARYAQQLKQKGDIGHIGFSSHKPDIATKVVETGLVEMMMFSINLAFDLSPSDAHVLESLGHNWQGEDLSGMDPQRVALYKLCESKGIGISVMKTLGASKIISSEHTPFSKPMTVSQCVHYALSRPAVYSTLLGCQSSEELIHAVQYLDASDEEKDYSEFLSILKDDFEGNCMYCSHCLPCPAEIDIASVNKFLDIALLNENSIPPSVEAHYRGLLHGGDACLACGQCEERCPFDVPIIENMQKAARLFADKA